jgi:hypothetical protein
MYHKEVLLPKPTGRDPNHLVYADLQPPHGNVKRVLCEVFLPQADQGEIVLRFHPTPRQSEILRFCPSFHLTAKGILGGHRFAIRAEQVWTDGLISGVRDGIRYVTSFEGRPAWLELKIGLVRQDKTARVVRGAFRLTPAPVIHMPTIVTRSYTGAVHVKRATVPRFTLPCGLRLEFRKHFDTVRGDSGQSVTTSHLVAKFLALRPLARAKFPEAVEEFDNFLTLVSFASRHRTVSLQWEFQDSRGTLTRHFRQDVASPREAAPGPNETLIEIKDTFKFLRSSYGQYLHTPHRELFDNSIFALLNERAVQEDTYLRCFSGVQSVLWYVYRNGGGTDRTMKIRPLFNFFQQKHAADLSDLWPLFDGSQGVPLVGIRNRLAHGEPISIGERTALLYAGLHLRWTLERLILTALRWPISKSMVKPEFLRHLIPYNWKSVIAQIIP